jgi:glycolate oxidase FAD binding subunit
MRTGVQGRIREAVPELAIATDAAGRPRVSPARTDDVAAVLALATAEGWRVRVEGRATWCPADAPADLVLTTGRLERIVPAAAGDLVATIEAGAALDEVNATLGRQGVWLALDPPGGSARSLGSIVVTGTAGPLRHHFGPVRDHLLGCTLVTGDGRVVRPGGAVVKNVAGYDLTRLMAGGFGGFGVITSLNVRLRAVPERDLTVVTRGQREALTAAARDLAAGAVDAVALEIVSPRIAGGDDWLLALRLTGTEAGVRAETARVGDLTGVSWTELDQDRPSAFGRAVAHAALEGPVTLRLASLPEGVDATLDLLAKHLDLALVSVSAGIGTIRWCGDPELERLRALRRAAASRQVPLTLERAPWSLRQAFGHFGAYREGVRGLVGGLRRVFDPAGILLVPLDGSDD